MMGYRASVHSSIGKTPNLMMLHVGRNVTLPLAAVVGKPPHSTDDHDVEPDEHIKRLQAQITINVTMTSEQRSSCYTEVNPFGCMTTREKLEGARS